MRRTTWREARALSEEIRIAEDASSPAPQLEMISAVVRQMMGPVLESFGTLIQRNTEAMERIAASQQMMSSRISDLEKQVRLKTPMSRTQEKHINDAIRLRARELLENKGCGGDRKAVNKLAGHIRRAALARYGVDSLREAPAYDYEVALGTVETWNSVVTVREIVREAKARQDAQKEECHADT